MQSGIPDRILAQKKDISEKTGGILARSLAEYCASVTSLPATVLYSLLIFNLAVPYSMLDLSSQTGDWTAGSCIGSVES